MATPMVVAQTTSVTLNPGDSLTVACSTNLSASGSATQQTLACAARAATPTPTPTGSNIGVCGESLDAWHPPVINGCATGMEHGDAPPAWLTAAGDHVLFHGAFNTSPIENTTKHAAMKAFSATFNGTDVYFRIHAASNPLDRSARYHSYEVFARDPSGAISHWEGWYNSGDPVADRIPRRTGGDPSQRPLILVVDQTSWNQGIRCEQWYSAPAQPAWGWDFGWTICNSTTLFQVGENATAANQATWTPAPDGSLGTTRRLEAAWYNSRTHPTGAFTATQFGEVVSGPNDPRCSGTTSAFGVTYTNVCLSEFIAPTMGDVKFPGNSLQKQFPAQGVHLPN
jgi:hypothetical protein